MPLLPPILRRSGAVERSASSSARPESKVDLCIIGGSRSVCPTGSRRPLWCSSTCPFPRALARFPRRARLLPSGIPWQKGRQPEILPLSASPFPRDGRTYFLEGHSGAIRNRQHEPLFIRSQKAHFRCALVTRLASNLFPILNSYTVERNLYRERASMTGQKLVPTQDF